MSQWQTIPIGDDPTIRHIPKFSGELWFVNGGAGLDGLDRGTTPDTAFATIGAAITACSVGDAITVKAGTYTEVGLDLNKEAVELWFEIGVIIDPAGGTALTISADRCRCTGMHKITPAAGEIGLLVSGDECHIEHGRVVGGLTCVSLTGAGNMLASYAAGFPTHTAYSITGDQARLNECATVGNAATYGYRINNSADTGVLRGCTSSGHTTSGFYIDAGSRDWTLLQCSSGAGDGRWVDVDHTNVWSGFSFDDVIHKTTVFAGAATEYTILKITGAVTLVGITGSVETVIPNTVCSIHLEMYSTGSTADITDAPGVNIDSAVVGAFLVRNGPIADTLALGNPAGAPVVVENAAYRSPETSVDVGADNGAVTYLRVVLSAALASGAIDWNCHWRPISDDGFVEPA